ncbi:MAG: hypothetical protein M1831_000661 [Alyxoria varia]|nr:MAG: hypothetical protein M1831_000661 [Alyxoria varia]
MAPPAQTPTSGVTLEAAAQATKITNKISTNSTGQQITSLNTVVELPDHNDPTGASFKSNYTAGDVRTGEPRVIGDEHPSALADTNSGATPGEIKLSGVAFDHANQSASGMQAKLAAAGAAPNGTRQPFGSINAGSGVPGAPTEAPGSAGAGAGEQARGISTASEGWMMRRGVSAAARSGSDGYSYGGATRGFWNGVRPFVRGALKR